MRVTLGARKHSVKPFWKQETVGKKMQQMFRQEIAQKRGHARAIDFRESESIDEEALKALIRAAAALNVS